MNEPTMETLARRLDMVERENRWLKQAGVVAIAVIAAVLLMGQATATKVASGRGVEVFEDDPFPMHTKTAFDTERRKPTTKPTRGSKRKRTKR